MREEHTYQGIQQNRFGVQRSLVRIPVSTIYYLVALGIVPDLSDPQIPNLKGGGCHQPFRDIRTTEDLD